MTTAPAETHAHCIQSIRATNEALERIAEDLQVIAEAIKLLPPTRFGVKSANA